MADAIVIGAGPNGLVAANMLADAGWDVLVIEEQDEPGGAVRSGEVAHPGFVHDRFSSFYPLVAGSKVMHALDLGRHGLMLRRAEAALGHPLPDGSAALIYADAERTAAGLGVDGAAWLEQHAWWERTGAAMLDAILSPFPPVRGALRLAARPRDATRIMPTSVRRFTQRRFATEGARLLFAANALHADFAPDSPGSAVFGMVLAGLAQTVGFPSVQGGASNLTAALVRRLRAAGGELECGVRAERVVVRGGRAVAVRTADGRELPARAVLADVGAPQLYERLVEPQHLPRRTRALIRRFVYDPSTVKVDWALSGPIPWRAPEMAAAGTVHVADSVDHLARAMADIDAGRVPERPFLVGGQYAGHDPSRQPPGTETFQAYTHIPQGMGPAHPDTIAERMEAELERVAPGFRARVIGRHVAGPRELEASNRNLVGGAINGGTARLRQQLVLRPIPGSGRATTPVRGLYLASASAHPGGGVHGACGANAARAALNAKLRR